MQRGDVVMMVVLMVKVEGAMVGIIVLVLCSTNRVVPVRLLIMWVLLVPLILRMRRVMRSGVTFFTIVAAG